MAQVFVSHASADDDVVSRLHDALEAATGRDLWVDHKDLAPPESNWRAAIHTALQECQAGLVVLSRHSVARPEVVAEWTYLLDIGRDLFIAKIDDVPPEDIDYRLHIVQWIDLSREWEAGLRALAASLRGEKLPDGAPVVTVRPITGLVDRRYTQIPISGREDDLAAIQRLLAEGPTSILGVGGLGKSRLAAEVMLTGDGFGGAVWHTCSDVSRADEVLELLRDHFEMERTTPRDKVLAKLRMYPRLVVIDNAESVPEDRRPDYVRLANELQAHGARVLITSRTEWEELDLGRTHTPQTLPLEAAQQIVLDMGIAFQSRHDLKPHAEAIARGARQHPGLIQWAVKLTRRFPPETVIRDLQALSSQRAQEALDEMIRKALRQMTEREGPEPEAALRRLAVCRGGFTYEAAGAILGLAEDEDALRERLDALQTWQFVIMQPVPDGQTRYAVDPLALLAVETDEAARSPHYEYYKALIRRHNKRQDYTGLDVESDNLETAFEWALGSGDAEAALRLVNACGLFLENRGRFRQDADWAMRVAGALADHPDRQIWASAQNTLGHAYRNLAQIEEGLENLRRAVAASQAALVYYTPEAAPLDYARTQNNLGIAYRALARIEEREASLRRAVAAYREALKYRTPEAAPLDYARTQNNLGNAYLDLAEVEEREENLRRAVAAYQAALAYYTPEAAPLDYAMTQNNLGVAYSAQAGVEEREENLRRAVAAFQAALKHRTEETAPLDYAGTQNNLGNAYRALAEVEERGENLRRAVAAYQAAMKYRTPKAVPLGYAMTQNNLGNAYRALAEVEERGENLRRAVAAYQAALVYYTPEAAPLDYGMTQNNLGIAYRTLAGVTEREENMRRAVVAFQAALVYRTAAAVPLDYAVTQANLGLAQEELGDLPAAVTCWREAERYFRQMGTVEDADKMLGWIAEAEVEGE